MVRISLQLEKTHMAAFAHTTIADSIGSSLPCLAMRPKDAAKALGIGERKLWELTNRKLIPHIKLGRCTLYPVDVLRDFLAREAGITVAKTGSRHRFGYTDELSI
jgi:Helix-turn-helix domain